VPDPPAGPLRDRFAALLDATGATARSFVLGALALGVLCGAGWWVSRQPAPPPEDAIPLVQPAELSTTTARPPDVVVHVAGAVVAPGVQRLAPGSRVVDAIEAAGGALPDAQLAGVNLAAPLVDGTQVFVPRAGEAAPTPAGPAGPAGPLDLNTATAAQLEELPGVGPATAAAILQYRQDHGRFATVEELLEVPGIGEAKLAQLRDRVRV
jgi:competence protein ComEA